MYLADWTGNNNPGSTHFFYYYKHYYQATAASLRIKQVPCALVNYVTGELAQWQNVEAITYMLSFH